MTICFTNFIHLLYIIHTSFLWTSKMCICLLYFYGYSSSSCHRRLCQLVYDRCRTEVGAMSAHRASSPHKLPCHMVNLKWLASRPAAVLPGQIADWSSNTFNSDRCYHAATWQSWNLTNTSFKVKTSWPVHEVNLCLSVGFSHNKPTQESHSGLRPQRKGHL